MSGGTGSAGAKRRVTCVLAATLAVGAGSGAAQEFAPGNILLSHQDVVWEYTPGGQRVSTIRVPSGPWVGAARDLLIDDAGRLRLTIGSPHMYLLAFDPATGAWSHETFDEWTVIGSGTYGGLALLEGDIFVGDMEISGIKTQGILRFRDGDPTVRFAEDISPIDVNIGLDGLLYALHPGGSPAGSMLDVYDPRDLSFVRRHNLRPVMGGTDNRAVAADAHGRIFFADWYGKIHRLSPEGELERTVDLWATEDIHQFLDIDITAEGRIVLGGRRELPSAGVGVVVRTDLEFRQVERFDLGDWPPFVYQVPEVVCPPDLDGDGELTFFDFLMFQGLFAAGDPRADFDGDGELTFFDFLAFQGAFLVGCP